jgi:hypothetical protein
MHRVRPSAGGRTLTAQTAATPAASAVRRRGRFGTSSVAAIARASIAANARRARPGLALDSTAHRRVLVGAPSMR